jgi:hypothetical protein
MVMHLLAPWVEAIVNIKKEDWSIVESESHDSELQEGLEEYLKYENKQENHRRTFTRRECGEEKLLALTLLTQ